jgi:hypothetical protein
MSTIAEEIERLRKESNEKGEEAARLGRLHAKYSDLKKHVNRWEKVRYCSASVNGSVQRFDIAHNCGCCSDSPLEVWPYLETEDGNVYSDPCCFRVGEKNPMFYADVPYEGWDEKMRAVGIPELIIGAVSMHFQREKKEVIEMAESFGSSVRTDGDDDG